MGDDLAGDELTAQLRAQLTAALKRGRRYSLGDVLEFTEVPITRLRRWLDAGIITTGGGGAQGKRREFSFRNLVEIAVCDDLRGLGVSEISLREIVTGLRGYLAHAPEHPDAADPAACAAAFAACPILWVGFVRFHLENDPTPRETLQIQICDLARLREFLIAGDPNGQFKVESGIAVPIGAIVADLEQHTGDTFA